MKAAVIALLSLALAVPALAAETKPAAKPAAPPAATPVPAPEPPPPYEGQLLRLAELMGALTYLRDLCHDGDGAAFRERMTALLEAEGRGEEEKGLLAGAFNRGYGDYQLTYRVCNASAQDTIASYLDESAKIARDVATRYGG